MGKSNKNNIVFEKNYNSSQYWINSYAELNQSALIIWHSCYGKTISKTFKKKGFLNHKLAAKIFPMLAGLSLELLLKACVVEKDKVYGQWKGNHSLLELANKLNIRFTSKEKLLLEIYTTYIRWYGKYPVPWTKSEYLNKNYLFEADTVVRKSGNLISLQNKGSAYDIQKYLKLNRKIWNKYCELRK